MSFYAAASVNVIKLISSRGGGSRRWKQTLLVIQERDNINRFSKNVIDYFGPYVTHYVDKLNAENPDQESKKNWEKKSRVTSYNKLEQHRGNFAPFLASLNTVDSFDLRGIVSMIVLNEICTIYSELP